ncbi:MAG: hypothetical protein JW782_00350 [Candidatus Saganbacteria bacterium]|nr:hypothetical protein [Candidatus Saganbacteria bacterium]
MAGVGQIKTINLRAARIQANALRNASLPVAQKISMLRKIVDGQLRFEADAVHALRQDLQALTGHENAELAQLAQQAFSKLFAPPAPPASQAPPVINPPAEAPIPPEVSAVHEVRDSEIIDVSTEEPSLEIDVEEEPAAPLAEAPARPAAPPPLPGRRSAQEAFRIAPVEQAPAMSAPTTVSKISELGQKVIGALDLESEQISETLAAIGRDGVDPILLSLMNRLVDKLQHQAEGVRDDLNQPQLSRELEDLETSVNRLTSAYEAAAEALRVLENEAPALQEQLSRLEAVADTFEHSGTRAAMSSAIQGLRNRFSESEREIAEQRETQQEIIAEALQLLHGTGLLISGRIDSEKQALKERQTELTGLTTELEAQLARLTNIIPEDAFRETSEESETPPPAAAAPAPQVDEDATTAVMDVRKAAARAGSQPVFSSDPEVQLIMADSSLPIPEKARRLAALMSGEKPNIEAARMLERPEFDNIT